MEIVKEFYILAIMSNTKIEIPEEFNVFLEDAINISDNYKRQGKDIVNIIQDIAKFQYYIKGRLDEIAGITAIMGAKEDIGNYTIDQIAVLMGLNKQLAIISQSLTES